MQFHIRLSSVAVVRILVRHMVKTRFQPFDERPNCTNRLTYLPLFLSVKYRDLYMCADVQLLSGQFRLLAGVGGANRKNDVIGRKRGDNLVVNANVLCVSCCA
jgi:hypothetical protein